MDFEEPRAMDDRPRLLLYFSLTLVKGDEVVQLAEEGANELLLGERRAAEVHSHKLINANTSTIPDAIGYDDKAPNEPIRGEKALPE